MADLNDTNKLGTYHISSDLQNYETARSNFFQVLIEGLDDLVYPEFSYTGENAENEYVTRSGRKSGQEVIKLSVDKMFLPHFTLGQIEVRRGNSVVKFSDVPTFQEGTIELHDFVGLEVKDVLMAWQALAYDVNSDTQGRAGDWDEVIGDNTVIHHKGYKKDCTLVEYTPDHHQIRYWELIGCWISAISESTFDVEATGQGRTITCTLQYDRAIMHQPDEKYSKVES